MDIKNRLFMQMMLISLVLCLIAVPAFSRGVNQSDDDFLAETFSGNIPKSKVIWSKGEVRTAINDILGHKFSGLRVRYWQQAQRTAWILEEIGKESPITFGIVIADEKVELVKVLAYRESRGGEIQQRAFTRQFTDASLREQNLDRHIDGISGATMSVRAMTSVVKMALYLTRYINE